jgi:AcrR family transcriptional regulator
LTEADILDAAPTRYAARKEEILAAAAQVLNDQGQRGFTLASVAKRLDLHPVSLTYYFKRRGDLFAACMLSTIARYEDLIADAELADDPHDRLRLLISGHLEVQRQARLGLAPPLASFAEIRQVPQPNMGEVLGAYRRMFDRLAALFLSDATPHLGGRRRALRARLMIEQLGWSGAWLGAYEPSDHARVAERLADVLIGGLVGPGRAWPRIERAELGAAEADTPEITRERFLIAATDLINEQGYHGASVDKISARLNVTKGSFYYHNADKDELILACFERTLERLREGQTKSYPGDGWERLCGSATSLAVYQALGDRGRMLRSYAFAALPPEYRSAIRTRFQQASLRFASMISDGIVDGSIRAVDPLIAAQVIMATVNSAAFLGPWLPHGDGDLIEQLYVRPSLMGLFAED